jgi:hypothetical protein
MFGRNLCFALKSGFVEEQVVEEIRLMGFSKFINNPDNSRTRERIYFHKLAFDLDVAAARKDYHLQMFEPEVDRE